MKKTLMKLIGTITILGIIAFAVTREAPKPTPKSLVIEAYASAEDLEAEKTRGILDGPADIAYPIDEIIITRQEETIRLIRRGEGKELTWKIEEPLEAVAVKFRVEKLIKLFKDQTTSVHTKRIKAEDHALFDFEPERRIGLTLKAKGEVWQGVDLVLGRVEEAESQAAKGGVAKDTWVMKAGQEDEAYRIGGKDLRSEAETPLSEFRDKKLFTISPEDIVEVKLDNPEGESVLLKGTRTESPGASPEAAPKLSVAWTIAAPAGFKADESVRSFVRNIANIRTKDFIKAEEGPKGGLGSAVWRINAKTHDGKNIGLRYAAEGDPAWAQVEGQSEWVQIEKYSLKNLQKGISDLRDKSLWTLKTDEVDSISFGAIDGKALSVTREGQAWLMNQGQAADMTSILKQIVSMKAKRYASASEESAAKRAADSADFEVRLKAGEKHYRLVSGPDITEGELKNHRWIRVNGGTPALLASFNAKRFLQSAEDLKMKRFFNIERNAIQSFVVTHPDKSVVRLERSAEGGGLELKTLPNGKAKTKAAAVGTMVGTLPLLKAKSFEPQSKASEVGLDAASSYRVEVSTDTGEIHTLLISKQSAGPDPYVMALTGPLANQVATISNFQAINLKKKAGELSQ